jgi:hypothetical protein
VPAETAIVDYRLSFADQGKQTFVFCFRLQQTNGSFPFSFPFEQANGSLSFSFPFEQTNGILPFSISFCSKQMKVAVFPLSLYIYMYISFETATCINIYYHFKRKTEAQTIFFLLPFAHCAN